MQGIWAVGETVAPGETWRQAVRVSQRESTQGGAGTRQQSTGESRWNALVLLQQLAGRARETLRDPQKRAELIRSARERLERLRRDPAFQGVLDQGRAAVRLVREATVGHYKVSSKASLWLAAGALLYLVLPTDAVPDFLPGGWLDDAAVLTFVFARIRKELERFQDWERWRAEFQRDAQRRG